MKTSNNPFRAKWHHMMPRVMNWLYRSVVLVVLLLSFHVHQRAGLTLPPPWNDEAYNLWQAKAVVETGAFLAPEQNPERPSMSYGGGTALAFGIVMQTFGFSLETVRWFCWLCVAVAWLFSAAMIRRLPWSHLLLAVAGLFFLAPVHVVTGNTARPDAMILLVATLGCWLLMKEQPVKAVFLCGMGVIIHPNALYFLFGVMFYTAITPALWRRVWPLSRGDWATVVCCCLPVAWSVVTIWNNWHWFHYDFFVIALPHNLTYNPLSKLIQFRWWLALLGGLFLAARLMQQPTAIWMLLGFVALLVALMGGEMWYDIYKMTGFMVMLTGGPAVLVHIGTRLKQRRMGHPAGFAGSGAGRSIALLYLLAMGALCYRHGFIVGPRHYPQKLSWGWGMVMPDPHVPYITEADKRAVVALAMRAAGGHPAPIIEFPSTGDSLLFMDSLPNNALPFIRRRTGVESQVVVYHLSRYMPPWVQN